MGRLVAAELAVLLALSVCGDDAPRGTSTAPSPAAAETTPEPTPGHAPRRAPRPTRLPQLPPSGFVVSARRGVLFVNLNGRVLRELTGLELAGNTGNPRVWLRRGRRTYFRLDVAERKLMLVSRSQANKRMYEERAPYLPLPSGVEAKGASVAGHWRYAIPSSDGSLLAQWSGECEIPTAYWIAADGHASIITGQAKRSRAPESLALGWSSGSAFVHLGEGLCRVAGDAPGIYSFTTPGDGELVFRTPRYAQVAMWTDQ